ncbi:GNAT family N-acetyltransferase [Alicyclobacillus sp. ALC3]|uniref:GNAT family N-acetyltransferase n=1 Tax=Alicyclobacillus sp. ALC3 TaxID=2796143 RepID=UPI0023783FDD|nr:GNAT family N-acetyltransferase [Alicyclobacillus sp. ALC3]WDL95710.1 GNAT family N-acetyltransferase [Alicyclobacillus sp. ALC3]
MAIQSERLLFRRYEDADLDFLAALVADPQVMRFIGNGQTRDRAGAEAFLQRIYQMYDKGEDMGLQVLVRRADKISIGHAGLVPQTVGGVEETEIGYWLARDFWGQGYAFEAALALRTHGEGKLHKTRLISLIQPGNTASRRIASKVGMTLDQEIKRGGQDVCVYSTSR